jgi:cell migration-inducing and hyaluronan-binding protein
MSKKNRSFLYGALLPALLLGSVIAVVQAQGAGSAKPMNWSNPATWPSGKVPAAGDKVEIAKGREVILDVSPPRLNGLSIDGKLSFSDKADLELTTEWIMLHGELAIGTEARPHTRKATITLTDNIKGEDVMAGMGDRGIMISGGTLNLHGNRTNAWTNLSKTAKAGATSIEVLKAAQWKVGDEIILASTDYDARQAERRTIAAIRGNSITLDKPLAYMHYGEITFQVDQRGEVGLLTRNIKIQASADAEQSFFGGHIMAMPTSKMFVSGVELNRMGQNLTLARYPIHWHLVGDAKGQYIRNAAIHDTYNRCVTVHGTNYLQVENNVTYNNVGHCFFMEDGIEHGNQFVRNLAIQTKCHTSKPCDPTDLAPFGSTADLLNFKTTGQDSKDVLIPSDNTVSSYWITNPDNTYVGNVAAGSDATGFWFAFPDHPTGQFEGTEVSKNTWPAQTRFREFRDNVAHSNFDSLMQDRGPLPNGKTRAYGYIAFATPGQRKDPVESAVVDFTAYKNRNSGIWARGEMHLYKGLRFADNGIGFTHAGGNFDRSFYPYTSRVVDSVFVGESGNIGNPRAPSEIAYGRSLPQPKVPDFPIRAYEFYDYHHELDNNTFVNYEDNATRKTGAISQLLFSSFAMSTDNTVARSTFIKAKPVYFPPVEGNNRWSNDDWGNTSYPNTVFHDKDGTITGVPDSFVINTMAGIDLIENCEVKPTWNAAVCTGDIGRMNVGGGGITGGGRPATFAIASGGGRIRGPLAPPGPTLVTRNGNEVVSNGETNVRGGSEFTVKTASASVNIRVRELDAGSWVMFKLPGFAKAGAGAEQNSLDALRNASKTSWFKADDALWVKLVSSGYKRGSNPGAADTLQVSR